jgi:hypothetical protein
MFSGICSLHFILDKIVSGCFLELTPDIARGSDNGAGVSVDGGHAPFGHKGRRVVWRTALLSAPAISRAAAGCSPALSTSAVMERSSEKRLAADRRNPPALTARGLDAPTSSRSRCLVLRAVDIDTFAPAAPR